MYLRTTIDEETASVWQLRLDIPVQDLAAARFNDCDRRIIENSNARNKISDILIAAALMALRIEQCIEQAEDQDQQGREDDNTSPPGSYFEQED